jgi:hypothetical protein
MPIDAGQIVTADELLRLQPVTYQATASSDLAGAATNADVPGATITLTTTAANAVYVAVGVFDYDLQGTTTVIGTGMLAVDGTNQTAQALFQQGISTDRMTASQVWRGTLAAAGSHTLKLRGTLPSGMEMNATHTTLTVTIYEVV